MEKVKINNTIYDVISNVQYRENPDAYGRYTAVHYGDYVYPIKSKNDSSIGVTNNGTLSAYSIPKTEEEKSIYSANNIIDFTNVTSLREVIQRTDQLRSAERSILTKADNVFQANIGENDTPIMKSLKQAINDKNIDLDKYEARFASNFHNDKRLLSSNNITINKFIAFLNKLDLKASLTIEDKNPDVPNPMGHSINIDLNPNGEYEDDE